MAEVRRQNLESRFFSNASINCAEPIIFHYTGAAGALGLIQTKSLWCTLVHHMNDSTELKYALEQARSLASRLAGHWDAEKRQRFQEELKLQHERIEHIHIFSASFSEGEDLLSQWRGYAGLNGYCIGFSLEAIRDVASKQRFIVGEVTYTREKQEALLAPIISAMITDCESETLVKLEPGALDKLLWKHTMAVARVAPLIKHPSFAEEREWRVYSDPCADHTEKYDFLVRNNEIVPYVKLDLDCGFHPDGRRDQPLTDMCARTFGVGPGANQTERSNALLAAVHRNKLYWRMGNRSRAPLR